MAATAAARQLGLARTRGAAPHRVLPPLAWSSRGLVLAAAAAADAPRAARMLHGLQVHRLGQLGRLSTLYIHQLPRSSAALEDFVGNMPSLRSLGIDNAEQEAGASVWAKPQPGPRDPL